MQQKHSHVLRWYALLLRLYPRSYRQEYGEEMLLTCRIMLETSSSAPQKRYVLSLIMKDFLTSWMQISWRAAEMSLHETPSYVRRNFSISSALIAPFFLFFIYNYISLTVRHSIPISHFEAHTWMLYTFVLPALGFVVAAQTCIGELSHEVQDLTIKRIWHEIVHRWLFIGFLIASLALVAIF